MDQISLAASPGEVRWLGLRAFLRRRSAVLGAALVVVNVLIALGATPIARVDPQVLEVKARLAPPTA